MPSSVARPAEHGTIKAYQLTHCLSGREGEERKKEMRAREGKREREREREGGRETRVRNGSRESPRECSSCKVTLKRAWNNTT